MRLLDRYIIKEWAKIFCIALVVTLGILLLEDVYSHLQDLLKYNVSFLGVLEYYYYLIPSFLPLILPVAFFVSLLFFLGNLHKNNEITAMRAAGMNVFQITRYLWLVSGFFFALLLFLSAYWIPHSVERAVAFQENLRFENEVNERPIDEVGIVENLCFNNPQNGHLWVINRFSEYTYRAFGVNVYLRDTAGREQSRLMAKEAYFDDEKKLWVFLQVRELLFEHGSESPLRSLFYEQKECKELTETPAMMLGLSKDPRDLSLFELKALFRAAGSGNEFVMRPYQVQYYTILASPFICLVVVGIAIPLTLGSGRANPFVSVSKAAALLFLYYILMTTCTLMGENGILFPLIAAWMPNIAMLALAVVYFWKKI